MRVSFRLGYVYIISWLKQKETIAKKYRGCCFFENKKAGAFHASGFSNFKDI